MIINEELLKRVEELERERNEDLQANLTQLEKENNCLRAIASLQLVVEDAMGPSLERKDKP